LTFDVQDFDTRLSEMLMLGGELDGPVRHLTHGKVSDTHTLHTHTHTRNDLVFGISRK
jgi:hypothetical protein